MASQSSKVLKFDEKLVVDVDFEVELERKNTPTIHLPSSQFQLDLDVKENQSPMLKGENYYDLMLLKESPNFSGERGSRITDRQKTPHPFGRVYRMRASSPLPGMECEISNRSAKKLSFKINKTHKNLLDTPKHIRTTKKINKPLIDNFLNLNISSISDDEHENNLENSLDELELEMFRNDNTNNSINKNSLSRLSSVNLDHEELDIELDYEPVEINHCDSETCINYDMEDHEVNQSDLEHTYNYGELNMCQEIDFGLVESDEDEELLEA